MTVNKCGMTAVALQAAGMSAQAILTDRGPTLMVTSMLPPSAAAFTSADVAYGS